MKQAVLCLVGCSLAGSIASAQDFEAVRRGQTALIDVVMVDNTASGGSYSDVLNAGVFNFEYTDVDGLRGSGQFAGPRFSTFCAELQNVRNGNRLYDVIQVTEGRTPRR